jgi:hypothetical protein
MPLLSRHRLHRLLRPAWLGTLRRLTPLSQQWGADRGTPVDRYYVRRFLDAHRGDIRGRVLEVKDAEYTRLYGSDVASSDVLDVDSSNPQATIVADLAAADTVPANSYDCFILTQSLQFVYDIRKFEPIRDYWRFTPAACTQLFADRFGQHRITVRAYGNILTSIAFLTGMAAEELSEKERERGDPDFPLLVTIRAVKAGSSGRGRT